MTDFSEKIIVNLFFVILIFLIGRLWVYKNRNKKMYSKLILMVTCSLAILVSMTFPIPFEDGYQLDFRNILLLIGGLYGGWETAVVLACVTISYRAYIGGAGVYPAVIDSFVLSILATIISGPFLRSSFRKRIIIITILSVCSCFFVIMMLTLMFHAKLDYFLHETITFAMYMLGGIAIGHVIEFHRYYTRLYSEMAHTEKLQIVSQLAASISHEVRNPLTTIRGFLQLLKGADIPKVKQEEFLSVAIEEVDRAGKIIEDYLTFAKPASHYEERLDVQAELNYIVEVIRPLAHMNAITCIIYNAIPCIVIGDRALFRQSLLNIAKNAIEAMKAGGTLTISVKLMEAIVQITIQDTGNGMTNEQISYLGEPYFSTKGEKGTGLGLVVTFHTIKSMNGRIEVYSAAGKGTNMTISLPIAKCKSDEELCVNS